MNNEYLKEKECFNPIGGITIVRNRQLVNIDIPGQTALFTRPLKKADITAGESRAHRNSELRTFISGDGVRKVLYHRMDEIGRCTCGFSHSDLS